MSGLQSSGQRRVNNSGSYVDSGNPNLSPHSCTKSFLLLRYLSIQITWLFSHVHVYVCGGAGWTMWKSENEVWELVPG